MDREQKIQQLKDLFHQYQVGPHIAHGLGDSILDLFSEITNQEEREFTEGQDRNWTTLAAMILRRMHEAEAEVKRHQEGVSERYKTTNERVERILEIIDGVPDHLLNMENYSLVTKLQLIIIHRSQESFRDNDLCGFGPPESKGCIIIRSDHPTTFGEIKQKHEWEHFNSKWCPHCGRATINSTTFMGGEGTQYHCFTCEYKYTL